MKSQNFWKLNKTSYQDVPETGEHEKKKTRRKTSWRLLTLTSIYLPLMGKLINE